MDNSAIILTDSTTIESDASLPHKNAIVKASHRKHPIHKQCNKAHRDNLRQEFKSKSCASETDQTSRQQIQQYVSVKQGTFRKQNDQERIPVCITNRKQPKKTAVQLNSRQRKTNSIKSSNALVEKKYNQTKNKVFRMES